MSEFLIQNISKPLQFGLIIAPQRKLPRFDLPFCCACDQGGAPKTVLPVGDARETDQTFGKLSIHADLLDKKQTF